MALLLSPARRQAPKLATSIARSCWVDKLGIPSANTHLYLHQRYIFTSRILARANSTIKTTISTSTQSAKMGSLQKANVLLVGSGGVGTMAAYALEKGGKASVTAVLRSNYSIVKDQGFTIKSLEHGVIKGWRPTNSECSCAISRLTRTPAYLRDTCSPRPCPQHGRGGSASL